MFQKAVRQAAKLRLAITGPSGAGKTITALKLAKHLVPGGRVAIIDTERRSSMKYAPLHGQPASEAAATFDADACYLDPPYHPDRYLEALRAAAGYDVVIVDSLSHAWTGPGGLLEVVDQIAARNSRGGKGNSFSAWKDATPIQNRLLDGLLACPFHLIVTMRSKMEYVLEEGDGGKKTPRKVGMAPIQRDGVEYEFDIVLDMTLEHVGFVSKTRCSAVADSMIRLPGKELADVLRDWLSGPAYSPVAAPQTAPATTLPAPAPQAAPEAPGLPAWALRKADALMRESEFLEDVFSVGGPAACVQAIKRLLSPKKTDDFMAVTAAQLTSAITAEDRSLPAPEPDPLEEFVGEVA